jgi:hypothetical protein
VIITLKLPGLLDGLRLLRTIFADEVLNITAADTSKDVAVVIKAECVQRDRLIFKQWPNDSGMLVSRLKFVNKARCLWLCAANLLICQTDSRPRNQDEPQKGPGQLRARFCFAHTRPLNPYFEEMTNQMLAW